MEVIHIIRLIATEFSSVTDNIIESWINLFRNEVSRRKFGDSYNLALAYFVCHKMKMAGIGDSILGELGSLKNGFGLGSVSDGGTSISFAVGGIQNLQSDAEFTMTIYGQQYLQLRKSVVVPISITGAE